jgi:hypothetical protein
MRPLHVCGLVLALIGMMALVTQADARRVQEKEKDKPKSKSKTKKGKDDSKDKDDKDDKGKSSFADLGDIHAEVTVLQVLQALQPTRAQLELLAKVAEKTMQRPPARKLLKVTDKYKKALTALRDALVSGNDDKIDEATSDLDDIRESEDPDYDETDITDEARKAAPKVLKAFSARQVATYIGGLDDFPDPLDQLREAIGESRKRTGKEWTSYRDDVAYQVGWLVAGLNTSREEKVRKEATDLLNKISKMSEKQFQARRDDLEKGAAEVIGNVGPTDIIRNFMERLLAEALSNHRLAKAIEAKTSAKD